MKKLCRKGTVHPSPAIQTDDQFLSLLPVAILSLVAALTVEDREVLAYLISNSGEPNHFKKDKTKEDYHSPLFSCDCFSCYKSYWVRWDLSPNRKLIDQIIEAFEDTLEMKKKKKKKRSGKGSARVDTQSRLSELSTSSSGGDSVVVVVEEEAKGSVGKIVSFIGQKVFGVWG